MCVCFISLKGADAKADAETDTKANAETDAETHTQSNAEKAHTQSDAKAHTQSNAPTDPWPYTIAYQGTDGTRGLTFQEADFQSHRGADRGTE
jgi:hypothetical protein